MDILTLSYKLWTKKIYIYKKTKHTEKSLAKMRDRKLSKEHLGTVLTRILSDEHKAKVRKANLGRKNSA
jgi:hypothetical protein